MKTLYFACALWFGSPWQSAYAASASSQFVRCAKAADEGYTIQGVPRKVLEEHAVPREVAEDVARRDQKDGSFNGDDWKTIDPTLFYSARITQLGSDGTSALLIHSKGEYKKEGQIIREGGGHNELIWVYVKRGNRYEFLIEDTMGFMNLGYPIPLDSVTHGYRDICVIESGGSGYYEIRIYKFNGIKYKKKRCTVESFADDDKSPNVTEMKCQEGAL